MEKIISLMQLIKQIDLYKFKVQKHNAELRDKEKMRSFVTLIYNNTRKTVKGLPEDTYIDLISKEYDRINDDFFTLAKLLKIKEEVNASTFVDVEFPIGNSLIPMKLSIASILSLKSNHILESMRSLENKLSDDYQSTINALDSYESSVMSNDRINTYVKAKFSSLNLGSDDIDSATYDNFAKEYREANSISILDPFFANESVDNVDLYNSAIVNMYNAVAETNIKVKLNIDLDKEYNSEDLWKYVD